jgi:hypothetical protein
LTKTHAEDVNEDSLLVINEVKNPGENMLDIVLNIERLAVEDFLGLEKEEIGSLSSQLNKALLG